MVNIVVYKKRKRIFIKKPTLTTVKCDLGEINIYAVYSKKQEKIIEKNLKMNFYYYNRFGFEYAKGRYLFDQIANKKPAIESFMLIDRNLEFFDYAVSLQRLFKKLYIVTDKNGDNYANAVYKKTGAYPSIIKSPTEKAGLDIEKGELYGLYAKSVLSFLGDEITNSLPENTDFYGLYFALKSRNNKQL